MEYYFFVIIVIVILKVLFWTFYFYVRAQRLRQARATHRMIIVGTRHPSVGRIQPYNDRSAIIHHAEPVSVQAISPPPYSEVVKERDPLPPPYEQAVNSPASPTVQAMPTAPPATYFYPGQTPSVQSRSCFPQQPAVVPPVATGGQNEMYTPPPSGQ